MIESKSFGSKAFKVINAIILILLAFSCFYPLWYTFCVSISSKAAAEGGLVTIYPIGSNVKSYSLIMGDSAFWNSFWISIKRARVFEHQAICLEQHQLSLVPGIRWQRAKQSTNRETS